MPLTTDIFNQYIFPDEKSADDLLWDELRENRKKGVLFHSDAVQAVGHLPYNFVRIVFYAIFLYNKSRKIIWQIV